MDYKSNSDIKLLPDDSTTLFKKIQKKIKKEINSDILIIGDTPLDVFWICKTSHNNIHQNHDNINKQEHYDVIREIKRPGTAYANAKLLKEFGFSVSVITCLGNDEVGEYISSEYHKIDVNLIAPKLKGASFQRHYILSDIESSGSFKGRINSIKRINHEPTFEPNEFLNTTINKTFYSTIKNAITGCNFLLINDTHKGTLTWKNIKTSQTETGIIYPSFIDLMKKMKKEISVLDCRKSVEHYKNLNIKFLSSSVSEIANALKINDSNNSSSNESKLELRKKDLFQLFTEYPNLENWALTRSAEGVQVGLCSDKKQKHCYNFPAAFNGKNTSGFTPHCGDFFDVGLIIGLSCGLETHESILFGEFLGALQAQQYDAGVINKKYITSSINKYLKLPSDTFNAVYKCTVEIP